MSYSKLQKGEKVWNSTEEAFTLLTLPAQVLISASLEFFLGKFRRDLLKAALLGVGGQC